MALTTVNITGTFNFPDATWSQYTKAEFHLSGYDTDTDVVVPKVTTVALGALGELSVNLWGNDDGLRGTVYRVNVVVYEDSGYSREVLRRDLGRIQIAGDGPLDIAALLDSPVFVPEVWYRTITQAEYDAAIAAAASAAESAEEAALYDGPKFDTIALMAASDTLTDGDNITVWSGSNGEPETFTYDATSTLTADGALVVDPTGMGSVGRLISNRTVFNDQSDIDTDPRVHIEGTFLTVKGQRVYKVASPSALDHHVLLDSGVKLYRVRDYSSQSSAAHFWKRVRGDSADVYVFIGSDSTGNGATEWPYLWATWLVGEAPTHTVKLRYWNDGTGAWDAYVTFGSGTGLQTIYVDVCAVGGSNSHYLQGGREGAIFERSDYALAILNYGHNLGTDSREPQVFHDCLIAAAHLHWRCPYASVVVTAQNPRTSANGLGQSKALGAAWRKVADLLGCGLIDVQAWFFDRSDWATALMLDETHPNDAGSKIWLAAVQSALAETSHMDMSVSRAAGPPSLSVVGQNLLENPTFHNWAAGANPVGWVPSNCTVSKQPGRSDIAKYSMEITAGAVTGAVSQSVPLSKLAGLKGKRVLFLCRIWKPTGMSGTAGRIDITSNNGAASVSGTSRTIGDASADGWAWVLTSVNVQPDALTLSATIYSGDGTDSGGKLWVQSAGLFFSAAPLSVGLNRVDDMVIDEYYSPLNVHPKSATDDGTLTADATSLTLVGATTGSTYTNTIIELPPLDAGSTYRFTFDTNAAGTGTGGVFARSAAGGAGSNLAGVGWTQSTTGNTIDFVPTSGIASLWIYGSGAMTGYVFSNITIEKL